MYTFDFTYWERSKLSPAFISKINFSTFLRCTYSFKLLIDDSVRIMR